MENNSIIVVIKFISGEIIKIECSSYRYDKIFVVCTNEKETPVFIAPSEQVKYIYKEKYRVTE